MKEMLKLGAILFGITAICAGLLGFINSMTAPTIAAQKEQAKQQAMKEVLGIAEEFIVCEEDSEAVEELYIGVKNKEYVGAVAKMRPNGYGGGIEMMVGIGAGGQVTAIEILTHTETPGLGANADRPMFTDQFAGKFSPLAVVKGRSEDEDIMAITGATITSEAVTLGVNQASEYILAHEEALRGGVQ
ncbi:MAG: RnfABCDGE type electron transport complex subunit G [Cellulosilyticaceae bacterium]